MRATGTRSPWARAQTLRPEDRAARRVHQGRRAGMGDRDRHRRVRHHRRRRPALRVVVRAAVRRVGKPVHWSAAMESAGSSTSRILRTSAAPKARKQRDPGSRSVTRASLAGYGPSGTTERCWRSCARVSPGRWALGCRNASDGGWWWLPYQHAHYCEAGASPGVGVAPSRWSPSAGQCHPGNVTQPQSERHCRRDPGIRQCRPCPDPAAGHGRQPLQEHP